MGVSIYYQAIAEQSTLFQRIQTEKTIRTLFDSLFPYGNGIFHIFEIDQEELDEILDDIVDNEIFNSRADVDRYLEELRIELDRANTAYSGLADRNAYLEKIHNVIEQLLSQELETRQLDNYLDYIEKLLYGDQQLVPLYGEYEDELLLVPSKLVQDGTQMLKQIEPALFEITGYSDEYYMDQFQWWKQFYLSAAENGEAVIVSVN